MIQEQGVVEVTSEERWPELSKKVYELMNAWVMPQFAIFKLLRSRQKAVRELASCALSSGEIYRLGISRINLHYRTEDVKGGTQYTMVLGRFNCSNENENSSTTDIFLSYMRTAFGALTSGQLRYFRHSVSNTEQKPKDIFELEEDNQTAYYKTLAFVHNLPKIPIGN